MMSSERATRANSMLLVVLILLVCNDYYFSPSNSSTDENVIEANSIVLSAPLAANTTASIVENAALATAGTNAHISWKCVPDMRKLINSTDSVIIVMPAKAGGTSLKYFAKECRRKQVGSESTSNVELPDNFLSTRQPDEYVALLTDFGFEMPSVVASHIWVPKVLSNIIGNASRRTLILYSHRDETSRFRSAATHVLTTWCPDGGGRPMPAAPNKFFHRIEQNEETGKPICYIKETTLVDGFLKKRYQEMQMGTNELLTCETYLAIEQYAPNMVFMDYKQSNDIQNMLAEKYCPQMVNHTNHVGLGGGKTIYISRKMGAEQVLLDDWMEQKLSYLEWTMGLNKKATCVVKTRNLEDELNSCDGGFVSAQAKVEI